jgi:hypothetical protein
MKKIWIKKFKSFAEAAKSDLGYYLKMSPAERLDAVQLLREEYFKINGKIKNEAGKGLRRVIKIIQQT